MAPPFWSAAASTSSLLNGQNPIRATVPIHMSHFVFGRAEPSPPMRRTSCSPPRAWMTMPAPRNRSALKNACASRRYMPAEYAPTPTAVNMYPIWLIVE